MKKKKKILNPKQKKFVKEYLLDLNATQAAIRAGYSRRTAGEIGHEHLKKPEIKRAIQKAMDKRAKRLEISQDRILEELAILAYSDLKHYLDIDPDTGAIRAKGFENMPENASRALKAIKEDRVIKEDADGHKVTIFDKVRFELHDKIKPLELLGKHLGMFKDEVQVSGGLTINVISAVPRPERKQ
jgi:phage terminase small subunit